jgi:hypothetical protein
MKIFQVIFLSSAIAISSCGSDSSLEVEETQIVSLENKESDDKLIDEAIKIVEGAGPPMQGIMTLLLYADSEKPNIKANFWLGKFGVQSEQYEKAKARFITVLELDSNHVNGFVNLLDLYIKMEDYNAVAQLHRTHPHLKSYSPMSKDLEEIINRLESDISVVSGSNE